VKNGTVKKTAYAASAAVRPQVRDLLERSPAFRSLPAEKRRQIANDAVRVASYLVDPDRLVSQEFASPVLAPNELLAAADFPEFVSGLINGVFGAIVNASVRQMEAYAKLVAHAATSVSAFARDRITADLARTELAKQFPYLFCISSGGALYLAGGVRRDHSTFAHLARALGLRRPWPAVGSADGLRVLVTAARRRVARERQKSFALALAMGINRIVVTDGRISARL
jgi:hypothetical protein